VPYAPSLTRRGSTNLHDELDVMRGRLYAALTATGGKIWGA